jgi:two-component system sensor histidine kinase UhpB
MMPLETGIEQMLSSLRGMLQSLSTPPLQQQGLRSAVADLVAAWQIKLHDGPRVVLDADSGSEQMPNHEYAPCIYRVVQECLNNIARHAPDSRNARICIRRQPQWLEVRVSNDLVRVRHQRTGSGTGMGLKLLAERVRALHGVFSVEMSAGQFAVQASLPMSMP